MHMLTADCSKFPPVRLMLLPAGYERYARKFIKVRMSVRHESESEKKGLHHHRAHDYSSSSSVCMNNPPQHRHKIDIDCLRYLFIKQYIYARAVRGPSDEDGGKSWCEIKSENDGSRVHATTMMRALSERPTRATLVQPSAAVVSHSHGER
jgi:hypothetical protein